MGTFFWKLPSWNGEKYSYQTGERKNFPFSSPNKESEFHVY